MPVGKSVGPILLCSGDRSMANAPRYCRPAAFNLLAEQLSTLEETASLVRAAIAVSMHELVDSCPQQVEQSLAELATEVAGRVTSGNVRALVAQLHAVLFDELGFAGNTDDYYNPANSYLPEVLKTRRGLPVTLSLIYKSVAQQVGLNVRGINSPIHFLTAVEMDGSWMIVDPFQDGRVLARDEVFQRLEKLAGTEIPRSESLLATATHMQWLARIIRNLEQIFQRHDRQVDMMAMRELMALVEASN